MLPKPSGRLRMEGPARYSSASLAWDLIRMKLSKEKKMCRRAGISIGVLIVAVLAATGGCSKVLDQFRSKHPDPPPGAFPPRVGKLVLEPKAPDKDINCTRADPLHCWAYYVLPGGDDELTRIHYFMQIYDS